MAANAKTRRGFSCEGSDRDPKNGRKKGDEKIGKLNITRCTMQKNEEPCNKGPRNAAKTREQQENDASLKNASLTSGGYGWHPASLKNGSERLPRRMHKK